jgi:hypothetical protein
MVSIALRSAPAVAETRSDQQDEGEEPESQDPADNVKGCKSRNSNGHGFQLTLVEYQQETRAAQEYEGI